MRSVLCLNLGMSDSPEEEAETGAAYMALRDVQEEADHWNAPVSIKIKRLYQKSKNHRKDTKTQKIVIDIQLLAPWRLSGERKKCPFDTASIFNSSSDISNIKSFGNSREENQGMSVKNCGLSEERSDEFPQFSE